MKLELNINIRFYPTFVELERNNMMFTIEAAVPHKAILTTRELKEKIGWKTTGSEVFEGEDVDIFDMAYRTALKRLVTNDDTLKSRVVEHLLNCEDK